MLTVHSISKSYGVEPVLHNISFTLNSGERLGLVGSNGSGKTTLLRIIAGVEKADSGAFHFTPPDLRPGYLPQGLVVTQGETISSYLDHLAGDVHAHSTALEQLALKLAANPGRVELQQAYDATLKRLEHAAQSNEYREEVLAALGLYSSAEETPVETLSGGQKTRLALAGVLLGTPRLLLLDEPTNHLDIDMLEWLESWLTGSRLTREMAILIVSHDRAFLDRTVTGILELDAQTHELKAYPGNYSDYLEAKVMEHERNWRDYTDQQEEIIRLRQAAELVRGQAVFRKGGKADSGDKFAKGFFANRSKGTVARAKNLEQRLEHLLTDERIEKPRATWQLKLDFSGAPSSGRDVIRLENLTVGYGAHALLRELDLAVRYGQRIALIGANGAGKTTLLRTISGHLPPLAGKVHLGSGIKIGYMAQEQENLELRENAFNTIRNLAPLSETDARTFLHQFLFTGDDVFTPTENLSFGERARLVLACLVASGCNLLLLDEPINHLDMPSRSRFEQALSAFEGAVIAVVHDRYFIHDFAEQIWEVKDGALRIIYR